jgi:choline/glycine/proline betaine transport protein
LPLSLRSCFYPLLKNKINGKWGNAIDVFALCCTFFGITTTGIWSGTDQFRVEYFHITPENSFIYQIIIVVCLVSLSVISAISGVGKGVKILSNINVVSVIASSFCIGIGANGLSDRKFYRWIGKLYQ